MTRTSPDGKERLRLAISVATITRILIAISFVLVIVSFSGQLLVRAFDWHPERDIVSFFNVDRERNLPTSFQSLIFLGCAAGLAAIAVMKKLWSDRWTRHWAGLALIFAGMAWDEITEVHERLTEPMRRVFDLQGVFFFGWIIPAGIIVALLGLAYLRFVLALERRTRRLFITAGITFLAGALILEGIGGWYYEHIDQNTDMIYVTITTVEETLEMSGMIVFLHAMLSYLSVLLSAGTISVTGSAGRFAIDAERRES